MDFGYLRVAEKLFWKREDSNKIKYGENFLEKMPTIYRVYMANLSSVSIPVKATFSIDLPPHYGSLVVNHSVKGFMGGGREKELRSQENFTLQDLVGSPEELGSSFAEYILSDIKEKGKIKENQVEKSHIYTWPFALDGPLPISGFVRYDKNSQADNQTQDLNGKPYLITFELFTPEEKKLFMGGLEKVLSNNDSRTLQDA